MLKVFVGFDPKEIAAFQVCAYSIWKNASEPVAVIPLNIRQIKQFENCNVKSSTEFAFTRFLVPHLCDFKGQAVFMDCDMLVLGDIARLFDEVNLTRNPEVSDVYCVQHDYHPATKTKFLNQEQTRYEKKNWSSVMLFNNEKCKILTKHYVNTASGLHLHQMEWASRVGKLPASWNHLVSEDTAEQGDADIVHFTLGGPYFREYENCPYSKEWKKYWREANSVLDIKILGEE